MKRISLTAFGSTAIQDVLGLEAPNLYNQFVSQSPSEGQSMSFDVSDGQWERIRPQLDQLAGMRLPLVVSGITTGRTRPVLIYTVDPTPGSRPRIIGVDTATISLAGGDQTKNILGTGLIPGLAAKAVIGTGNGQLTFTAARKGPNGNLITINILAALGGGSVSVVFGQDGVTVINVVPAAGGTSATAIRAQMNAAPLCALFVTTAHGGTGANLVGPTSNIKLGADATYGGSGCGTAWVDLACASAVSKLRVEAKLPGNLGNNISVTILAAVGLGSVVVTGTNIVVTPAAAGIHSDDIRDQINAEPTAAVLVVASIAGAASVVPVTGQTFLCGGSGETPTVLIGGLRPKSLTSYSDTAIVCVVSGADYAAAGFVAGDAGMINLLTNYGTVIGTVWIGA